MMQEALRATKYISTWIALNVALAALWSAIGIPAQITFLLGILHGGVSQAALMFFYTDRKSEPEDTREFVICVPKTAWRPMPKPDFNAGDME